MKTPHFSVIIPAHNASQTIRSTVASVLLQSDRDLEIILVDDGSTDDTLSLLLDIGCKDARIRVVSQPNGGVSSARNFGASLAKGSLLAFLDADDQWESTKLAKHRVAHDADPMLDVSFAQVAFCSDKVGQLIGGRSLSRVPEGYLDVADVVVENPVCTTSNFVIRRHAFEDIGGFDESLRYAEDQEILARLLGFGHLARGISEELVLYRMSEDGLSCDFDAMLAGWLSFAGQWLSGEELAEAEASYCRYLTRRALRSGAHIKVARSFAKRGLEAHRASFMAGGSRSLLTLGGVIAGAVMPVSVRRAVFA
jgi:glycosyltransferase involved in cell wall biosynthesis